jgi:hypothetical protein
MIEALEIGRGDVAGENVVTRGAESIDDRFAADKTDFALGAGTAVQNCDFHSFSRQ